ncbi:Receptor-like serine/threonine-protein kinase SD1-8 [Cocos nucifera]|uniref:Receptor-like serine/threonine-protein kinase n=1 Tax=Cocos nucifera TaxID=13894 RepID=A0A8K0IWM2_COCNU|nr:Receptor-like serine/threonine-protein kinase SD1-8 [Cocos nucifera]
MKGWSFPLLLVFTLFSPSIAGDSLTPTTPLVDGQTLVSTGGIFELGFFSPGNSPNRYLGIWFKKIPVPTIVWVANRAIPLTDSDGVLKISKDGSLVLCNGVAKVLWTSGSTVSASNPVAQLLDSGNFVLGAEESSSPESFAWQSFDYPSDTLLPGMKLGWNLKTGLNRYISSWKSSDDPSPGSYSFKMDPHGSPELFLYEGSKKIHASGPWNGLQFSGIPELKPDEFFRFIFVSDQDEVYYTYEINKRPVASRLVMNTSGLVQRFVWPADKQAWALFWWGPRDWCDYYAECGPFGVCNSDQSPVCSCLEGFKPKSPQEWNLRDCSDGCVRITPLGCKGDGFIKLSNMKLPETISATVDKSMSLDKCRESCLKNCSCRAYASANISGGESGCIIWATDLIDLRNFVDGGQDLHIRLPASEIGSPKSDSGKKKILKVIIITLVPGILLLVSVGLYLWKKNTKRGIPNASIFNKSEGEELELPLFDLFTIESATDCFSIDNKLGEGGFGPVYKGRLEDGQEIAVKRLSKYSVQGLDQFKNEVVLIAKLQHRNLVRLLGCCIQGEERLLIYEYMQNKSLDSFIFDKMKGAMLNWQKRLDIIIGIGRGLLYLHQDSRLKIIHRDLKAGNVLLDKDMNPKISDFGIARIFHGDQNQENTRKVVGTFGYMSPEYATDGIFSVKSDVFSFGILILEILSGKKNKMIYQAGYYSMNLIGHAWRLWKEGRCLELLDEAMEYPYPMSKGPRCIQVGLLCVQEKSEDRPTMAEVVLMLSNEGVALPQPKRPGFCIARTLVDRDLSSTEQHSVTANEVTITILEGR